MAGAALVLAAIADAATFALLPPGSEANPLAAHWPLVAIGAKAIVSIAILAAPLGRYATRVRVIGAVAWSAGFISNALVIWR